MFISASATEGSMKKGTKSVLLCSALFCLLFANRHADAVTVRVNPGVEHQEFEGWGTSICWWGNIVGKYPDQKRDSIMDLLFDTADGLGLSIVRYNIGGGDNPSHHHMGTGKMMDGFKASESAQYDWTKDAGQRWCLEAAKDRIPSDWFIAEAFSNSPPYWMTNSGCASGNSGGSNNLKSGYFDDFADYLTEVVKHFRDTWNITFRTLEPMNEPMVGWSVNGGQEGCHIDVNQQDDLIREVKAQLDAKGLTETKISAPDETSIDQTVSTWNSYDAATKACVFQINTHVYYGSRRSELRDAAKNGNKILWDSECDGSGAAAPFDQWTHNHNDIVPGLDIANRALRDLRDMQVNGWVFWQAVESEQTQTSLNKNWGLIHADFNGGTKYYIPKKYYAVRQFSGFIRPHSTMIDINNNDAVAFVSKERDRLIIVQRNAANSTVTYDYGLSDFERLGSAASVWRTSGSENCKKLDDLPVVNGILSATSPAKSITTYVLQLNPTAASVRKETAGYPVVNVRFSGSGLQVTGAGSVRGACCRLYDLGGKLVASFALHQGAGGELSGSHDLPSGNYLAEIVSGAQVLHMARVVLAR